MNYNLNQYSNQPHIKGGFGVFTAWVMLKRIAQNETVKPKSIIKLLEIKNVTIYPNPAREEVTVTGASNITFAIIYDIQGREILSVSNSDGLSIFNINTSKLSKGAYFIKLIRSDLTNEKVEKLIIN